MDPLPERVRLVEAPGDLRGRELDVLGWQVMGGETALVCRLVDGAPGVIPVGWTDLAERPRGQESAGVVASLEAWRLLLARGVSLRGRADQMQLGLRHRKTVEAFLDALGEERCKQVELVSCDMAAWIAAPISERLPDAVRCVDPFHVVGLATDALDEIRREVWNEARRAGQTAVARDLKGARFALWKNPEVRHEAPPQSGGDARTPPPTCRSRSVKLRAA